MFRHRTFLFVILVLVTITTLPAQTSPSANEIMAAISMYKDEALGLSSVKIWDKYQSVTELQKILYGNKPFGPGAFSKENLQALGYLDALRLRKDMKEPEGTYYYSMYQLSFWDTLSQIPGNENTANKLMNEILDWLKFAADEKYTSAMYSLAMIYKNGYGVRQSNLVAVDWLCKQVEQDMIDGYRDSALSSVEEALRLVPDHPTALRLRKQLLQ